MLQRQRCIPAPFQRGKFFACKAICTYAATAQLALAATREPDPFELSPEQLFGATVMSASRSSEKLWDAPAAIYVLTSEDIKRSGATAIPEALRLVPGVQVARTHAGGWAVSVRGFNADLANKLLVLIDGREVYDPLFSGVYWDIQDTMLEDIDRIEVIRGPGASLWGANAVNGVINIITKSAADTQGGLTSVTAGTRDRAIVSQRYGGTFGEDGHYRVYGKYLNRDEERAAFDGLGAEDEQIARRGGFRADWGTNDGDDNFTLQGDIYQNRDGQLRDVPNFVGPDFSALTEEKIYARGGNLLGRWNRTLNSGARMTLQSYVDYTARDQALVDDTRTTLDLDGQVELPQHGRHAIVTGARYHYSYDDLDETGNIISTTNASRNDQLVSAFVQDKITLDPERWYLTLGSKLEHNDYTGFEIQPNARLQWHPDAQQMLWGSVSRAARTPSRLEEDIQAIQAVGAGPISLDTLPNDALDSEELIAYELGYRRHLTPTADLDLAAFYNDYSNLVNYGLGGVIAGTNPTRVVIALVPTNSGRAEIYGGEATLNWRAIPDLNLSGSYSVQKIALHGPSGASVASEGQSPQQQFNLRAQWDISDALTFDTMLYYVDGLPDFGIEHYWRLDTRLGWRIADGLEFNLVGQDLLDNQHPEFGDATGVSAIETQRAVYGQFLWHF